MATKKKRKARKAPAKRKKGGSKLGGQYVGLLNALTREQKATVKKVRERSGLAKAVSRAKKLRASRKKKK